MYRHKSHWGQIVFEHQKLFNILIICFFKYNQNIHTVCLEFDRDFELKMYVAFQNKYYTTKFFSN